MRLCSKVIISILAGASALFSSLSQADIVINGTRVVYREGEKNVNMRLDNRGTRPLLVQSWLDTGEDNADPASIKVPFNAPPPVSRIESKHGQTITITYTGSQALPKDRESIFWFNVLEIPPKPDAKDLEDKNLLQMAFRTRIKLFYRPKDLAGEPLKAAESLKWRWDGNKVRATNPTPYYISFSAANLKVGGKEYEVTTDMLPPKSEASFAIKGLTSSVSGAKLNYTTINDYGSGVTGTASL